MLLLSIRWQLVSFLACNRAQPFSVSIAHCNFHRVDGKSDSRGHRSLHLKDGYICKIGSRVPKLKAPRFPSEKSSAAKFAMF